MIALADPFVDPVPYVASGLQPARCACGALALVDAEHVGDVRCGLCWRALRGAWPVTRSHFRDVGWPAATPSRQRRPPSSTLAPPPALYRVLTPARPAERREIPYAASALAVLAERNGWRVRTTYALAEDAASGALTHSIAVRLAPAGAGRASGYAVWHNERFRSAVWLPTLRRMTLAELSATVEGVAYVAPERAAPIVGPCPRCWRHVRWTRTGKPYAHKDLHTKTACT